jgi:hypothetical protein
MVMAVSEGCPSCGEPRVHRSRLKSPLERLRRVLTRRTPFRCERCNWRGWRRPVGGGARFSRKIIHPELTDAELDRLDPERAQGERR